MRYEGYTYLWPPRPSKAIPENMIHFYESRGWVAQMKKNGTNTVMFVTPDKEIITKTRHNADHKAWDQSSSKALDIFASLPGDGWYVLNCELLHSKTSLVKDTFYVWDILVADGDLLVGKTYTERQDILKKLFNVEEVDNVIQLGNDSHYILNEKVWLAKTITNGFDKVMRLANAQKPEKGAPVDEGIVMKNPSAKLEMPGRKTSNSKWQVKCRIAHKNYDF